MAEQNQTLGLKSTKKQVKSKFAKKKLSELRDESQGSSLSSDLQNGQKKQGGRKS